MENQKLQHKAGLTPNDSPKTPKKRMSVDSDYMQWGVEETCRYLQTEGLEKWEDKFRGDKITGVRLRYLKNADLEKIGIECLCDQKEILYSIRKLWLIAEQKKVFNDPIHGHVELHPLLVKIIDTPQFQRLRYIKQLGGAYFVYPGASHNRFEHSIGVGHLAGQLVEALRTGQPELKITDGDILCVQIAGLCHDLGHGPFSHLFDGIFIPKARPGFKWKHEAASLAMFDHMVKENGLEQVMKYDLELPEDLVFIKEMIGGPPNTDTNAAEDQEWPYEGRTKDKSFLYEIVANKRNGIDVDKFDYFARDCLYLGIQNNFDFRRFLKFARVCEVDGQKHICTRDKEVANLYDMFHTRNCLHRRAYQHKVNKIIEIMIAEAFFKADKYIQIEGSGGKMFTLSTAIDDMEAYTKLTDHVFEQILNFPSLELARGILKEIISCTLEETTPNEEMIRLWEEDLDLVLPQTFAQYDRLTKEDFEVLTSSLKLAEAREILHKIISESFNKAEKPTEEMLRRWKEKFTEALPQRFAQHVRLTKKKFEVLVSLPELAEAREILHKIISRKHYKFLGETKTEQSSERMIHRWKEELSQALPEGDAQDDRLKPEDFEVSVVTLDYGMKDKNPINSTYFYRKKKHTKAFKISKDQVSKLLPTCFSEQLIRVYSRKTDKKSVEAAEMHLKAWCKKKGFPFPQDGDAVTETELNPEENVQNNQSEVLEDGDQN